MANLMKRSEDLWPRNMVRDALAPDLVTIYFNHANGLLYVQSDGNVFEMSPALNVTEEISLTDPDMEPLKTVDQLEIGTSELEEE